MAMEDVSCNKWVNKKRKKPEIATERVERAADELLKWLKAAEMHQKPQLLDHDEFIYLVITLNSIPPKPSKKPARIPLPNPVYSLDDGAHEICLVVNDADRSPTDYAEAKRKVREEALPISKVLRYTKLRTDYKPFEARRKLCGSFDLFLADRSVIPLLPRYLGKPFFLKKKHPVSFDLRRDRLMPQLQAVCASALLFLSTGTCSVLKIGRSSQTVSEIAQNVNAVLDSIAWAVPGNWKNIRSLHLKSLESCALPLYQALPLMPLKISLPFLAKPLKLTLPDPDPAVENTATVSLPEKRSFEKGRIRHVRYMDFDIGGVDGEKQAIVGDEMSTEKKNSMPTENAAASSLGSIENCEGARKKAAKNSTAKKKSGFGETEEDLLAGKGEKNKETGLFEEGVSKKKIKASAENVHAAETSEKKRKSQKEGLETCEKILSPLVGRKLFNAQENQESIQLKKKMWSLAKKGASSSKVRKDSP